MAGECIIKRTDWVVTTNDVARTNDSTPAARTSLTKIVLSVDVESYSLQRQPKPITRLNTVDATLFDKGKAKRMITLKGSLVGETGLHEVTKFLDLEYACQNWWEDPDDEDSPVTVMFEAGTSGTADYICDNATGAILRGSVVKLDCNRIAGENKFEFGLVIAVGSMRTE